MRFKVVGIHTKPIYGLPPTGKRVEVSKSLSRVVDGAVEAWVHELGPMLQLGIVNDVERQRCRMIRDPKREMREGVRHAYFSSVFPC
jgi:hypothetical protein